jgi:gamma-glutamylcyclotransferase (GGCT)/AIG2-like uncharacterized protein YtfP
MSNLYYFAYGSNMNSERVRARGLEYSQVLSGQLSGYELSFNKYSANREGSAANITKQENAVTEGVLYLLSGEEQIIQMDPFEGFPDHYSRELLSIATKSELVKAWVYIANQRFIRENLLPPRWYLNHLLAGKQFLTQPYYERLKKVECISGTDLEPR